MKTIVRQIQDKNMARRHQWNGPLSPQISATDRPGDVALPGSLRRRSSICRDSRGINFEIITELHRPSRRAHEVRQEAETSGGGRPIKSMRRCRKEMENADGSDSERAKDRQAAKQGRGEAPQLRRGPEAWRLDCDKLSWVTNPKSQS